MGDELTWMPAWQIREPIVKGEVSPVEVTEHFLGRIEEHGENVARPSATSISRGARPGEGGGDGRAGR